MYRTVIDYLTLEDVARELNVSYYWVYERARAGLIPAVRVGKFWRIPIGAYREWRQRLDTVGMTA